MIAFKVLGMVEAFPVVFLYSSSKVKFLQDILWLQFFQIDKNIFASEFDGMTDEYFNYEEAETTFFELKKNQFNFNKRR